MATHLPQLELVGERIPTPLDWSRSPEEQNSPSPQSNEELFITDVETPYLVESWLQGSVLLLKVIFLLNKLHILNI